MYAQSNVVRLVSAALAVAVTAVLVMTKVHFHDELARLTAKHDAFVLPVVQIVGERPANLALVPPVQSAN